MELVFVFLYLILIHYLGNKFVHHLIVYILLHLCMITPLVLFHLPLYTLVYSILLIIALIIIDICLWFNYRYLVTMPIPLSFIVIFIGIFIYAYSENKGTFASTTYYLGQIFVVSTLINMYIQNVNRLPKTEEHNNSIYKQAVLNRSNTYVFIFLSFQLAINCIIHLPLLEKLGNYLVRSLGHLLQIIFRFIFRNADEYEYIEPEIEEPVVIDLGQGNSSNFAKILEAILMFVGVCIIVLIVFICIKNLIKLVSKLSYRGAQKYKIEREDGTIEFSQKLEKSKRQRMSVFKFGHDTREKIRKRYVQEIKHQIKQGYYVKDADTPNERATELLDNRSADIKNLTDCYNIARYSDKPLTSKDWNELKKHI